MTGETPIYEAPALVEVGEFADLTLGVGAMPAVDYPMPFYWG